MISTEDIYTILSFLGSIIMFVGSYILVMIMLMVFAEIFVSNGFSNALYPMAALFAPAIHYTIFRDV